MLAATVLPRVVVGSGSVVASRSMGCAAAATAGPRIAITGAAVSDGVTARPVLKRSLVTSSGDSSLIGTSFQGRRFNCERLVEFLVVSRQLIDDLHQEVNFLNVEFFGVFTHFVDAFM
jgi:hypothetical protein